MARRKRRATTATTPTKNTKRRISTRRQIEEEESTMSGKSIEEEGSTRLEKSTEEEEEAVGGTNSSSTNVDASNDKSKSNENVEGGDRGFDDEQRTKHQHNTPILEEEISHTVESSSASPSPDTSLVKPIRYSDYNFETTIDKYPGLMGSVNVKSGLGKCFSEFRKILEDQKLMKFFKSSIFENYLHLPNNVNIRFQMNLVYQLLLRKIKSKRKEEVWINYCGMPICFGMREFAIITGLNCHLPEVYDEEKLSTKTLRRRQQIIELVGKTCKEKELIEHLKSEDVCKSVKKSLCLLYFVHNFLCAKNLNTNIPSEWILLSADRDAFSAHPWGRVSYDLTIDYLLKAVNPNVKTSNLYGFPWAFMCWASEAIPPLRKKFKVFSEEVSSPRILRWLSATNNISVEIHELFDPPEDSIVHPWIIATPSEMEMDFLTRFVPLHLTKDDKIEKLERDLNGIVAIKRDCTVVEKDIDPARIVVLGGNVAGESSQGFGVGIGGGGGVSSPNIDRGTDGFGAGGGGSSPFVTSDFAGVSGGFGVGRSSPIGENVSHPQETRYTTEVPSCKLCHEKIDLLTTRIEALEKAIISMMSKRGIRPSLKISDPYTPDVVKRRKKQITKILSCVQKKAKRQRQLRLS